LRQPNRMAYFAPMRAAAVEQHHGRIAPELGHSHSQDDLGKAIYSAVYGKGVYTVDPTGTDWVEITQNLPIRQ
jgi:hypothetical protein